MENPSILNPTKCKTSRKLTPHPKVFKNVHHSNLIRDIIIFNASAITTQLRLRPHQSHQFTRNSSQNHEYANHNLKTWNHNN